MNREEVLRVMGILATEFGGLFDVTEERAMLWVGVLEPLDYHEAQRAAIALLTEDREFPPRVGELFQRGMMIRRRDYSEAEMRRPRLPEPKAPEPTEEELERNKAEFKRLLDEKFPNRHLPGLHRLRAV
jgi:hypothetical protein